MSGLLDRQGPCPQCGATITFPFAAAAAQICPYCRFAIVRTDRAWVAVGRVADLLPLPSPLPVGASASLGAWRLRVAGRVQYDRHDAPSAPWQELFIEYATGAPGWLAFAQGRCYATWQAPAAPLPTFNQAAPGTPLAIPGAGNWVVAERGARRLLSGEGMLPFPIRPGAIEWYADLSGPSGAFATIDYGDGSRPPALFVGNLVDPSQIRPDVAPAPAEPARVSTKALSCHSCGASLPLTAPGSAQRVICQYCGGESDLVGGVPEPAGKVKLPSAKPEVPLGAAGKLHGQDVICVGFMVRGTTIDDEHYAWREYLLFVPSKNSYVFLLEDEGNWEYIVPIDAGDVELSPDRQMAQYQSRRFEWSQSITAKVQHVIGEFYWKVEIGETVTATEWRGPAGAKLNEERDANEIVWSHAQHLSHSELQEAFSLPPPATGGRVERDRGAWFRTGALLLLVWGVLTAASSAMRRNQVVFDGPVAIAAASVGGALADDAKVARGRTCRDWRQIGVSIPECATPSKPAASAPSGSDDAFFTPAFDIEKDKRSLHVELSAPSLSNTWVGTDVALIRDDTGEVQQASLDLEYYYGSDSDGAWSEGSRHGDLWFSRIDAGRYLLRVDPSWETGKPPPSMHLRLVHDTSSDFEIWGMFTALLTIWFTGYLGAGLKGRRA